LGAVLCCREAVGVVVVRADEAVGVAVDVGAAHHGGALLINHVGA